MITRTQRIRVEDEVTDREEGNEVEGNDEQENDGDEQSVEELSIASEENRQKNGACESDNFLVIR